MPRAHKAPESRRFVKTLALEIDPLNAGAWSNMGISLTSLGRHDEALRCYETALELEPKATLVWYNKVLLLRDMGRLDEAIASGDKVLELVEYAGLPSAQIGFSHFGLRVADLDETWRRARALGVPILVEPTDISGTRVMFIEDPDGNRFEIGEFAEWPAAGSGADAARRAVAFFAALATRDPAQILRGLPVG